MEAVKAKIAAAKPQTEAFVDSTAITDVTDAETTDTIHTTTITSGQTGKIVTGTVPKKKVGKPKLSAKEKKERSVSVYFL